MCIGDHYRIGDAVFEVTQPRVTCYRVGIRMNEPQMAALLVSHGRPGFYFRVLEEGEVGAGDEIMKVKAGPERVTVAEINALLYLPGHPASGLERAVRIPALSAAWRTSLEALLVFVDRVQVGFFEIAVNPIGTGVDQRDQIFADRGVITELRQQVRHIAVDRRADLSALQIDPRPYPPRGDAAFVL